MSVQAMAWVLDGAQGLRPQHFATLMALANQARDDGTGAWPSVTTMARQVRKSTRQVQADLRALEEQGLIRQGDQRMVAHLPPGRRPTVYNLAVERTQEGAKSTSPLKRASPVNPASPDGCSTASGRGEAGFTQPVTNPINPPNPQSGALGACDRHAHLGRKHNRCRDCGTAGKRAGRTGDVPVPPVHPSLAEMESAERCDHGAVIGKCGLCWARERSQ